VNTWGIAPYMGSCPRALRVLAAYHQSVHVQLAAVTAAPVSVLSLLATGAASA